MPNLGPLELTIIFGIFLLLFGAKKLPELGSSVGRSIRSFKKGINESDEDDQVQLEDGTTVSRPGK